VASPQCPATSPVRHVKLTEHFLGTAYDRLSAQDMGEVMLALADGSIQRTAHAECSCPGQDRLALSVGRAVVIVTLDENDPEVTTVLTVLGPEEQKCLNRRSDTRAVRLQRREEGAA
jgi:hypothetical protein